MDFFCSNFGQDGAEDSNLQMRQYTFDHNKGQKCAISARRLHWIFLVEFSRFYMYLVRKQPEYLEIGDNSR